MTKITVAALQLELGGDTESNIAAVTELVREAAGKGGHIDNVTWGYGFSIHKEPKGPTEQLSPGSYGHGLLGGAGFFRRHARLRQVGELLSLAIPTSPLATGGASRVPVAPVPASFRVVAPTGRAA